MPRYPEYGDDDFSLMVDPFSGRVALVCPAPIIAFDTLSTERFSAIQPITPPVAGVVAVAPFPKRNSLRIFPKHFEKLTNSIFFSKTKKCRFSG